MAKNIPIQLLNEFGKRETATAYLIKILSRENTAYGFTSSDKIIRFNDGFGLVEYFPDEELSPQNIQSTANMTVDNTKLVGWFKQAIEQKVLSGAFDAGEVTIYRVAYLNIGAGAEIVGYGRVGEVEYNSDAKDKRKIEFRSLTQQLTVNGNLDFSLTCRAQFGDNKCKMPFEWNAGTIETIPGENPFLVFKVNGIARPENYFELGVINYIDGPNAGADLEIESWSANGLVKLSFVSPYAASNGTAVRLRKDCGKTESDCLAYGNIVNMRAEHLTPTEDRALMVPGAYVKSSGSA